MRLGAELPPLHSHIRLPSASGSLQLNYANCSQYKQFVKPSCFISCTAKDNRFNLHHKTVQTSSHPCGSSIERSSSFSFSTFRPPLLWHSRGQPDGPLSPPAANVGRSKIMNVRYRSHFNAASRGLRSTARHLSIESLMRT